jgi:hypothetical protein
MAVAVAAAVSIRRSSRMMELHYLMEANVEWVW